MATNSAAQNSNSKLSTRGGVCLPPSAPTGEVNMGAMVLLHDSDRTTKNTTLPLSWNGNGEGEREGGESHIDLNETIDINR